VIISARGSRPLRKKKRRNDNICLSLFVAGVMMSFNGRIRSLSFVFVALLVTCVVSPFTSMADEISLTNGDRISGKIIGLDDKSLSIGTAFGPKLEIAKEHVLTLSSQDVVIVLLDDGEVLAGVLTLSDKGELLIGGSVGRDEVRVAWSRVRKMNPQPIKWSGAFNLGGNRTSGNTESTSVVVDLDAFKKRDDDRITLRFLFNYADEGGEMTARNTYGMVKYDDYFTAKAYGYLNVDSHNDRFRDLRLRTSVGTGVGYQFWSDNKRELRVEGGVSFFNEDMYDGDDDQWFSGRFAFDFSARFLKSLRFAEKFVIYPSLEESGLYQLRNEAGLSSPLFGSWAMRLSHIFERDSDPESGVKKDDTTWIVGLQYNF